MKATEPVIPRANKIGTHLCENMPKRKRLRIGMLAPISWPMPPKSYGPWEQVAYNLSEELVERGHEVTVFAAGGSRVSGKLVVTCPHPLDMWPEPEKSKPRALNPQTGFLEGPPDGVLYEEMHIAECLKMTAAGAFDIVHNHLHAHTLQFADLVDTPLLTTLHGVAWNKANHPALLARRHYPFVSLSNKERDFLPELNYVATVPNGIVVENFPLVADKDDYLLFAGRLAPEKGPAEAVELARRTQRRLILAGMIEPQYRDYYQEKIAPFVDGKQIRYEGLMTQKQLAPLYQRAAAVLFLLKWDEPFGLVAAEAQAAGTAILAFPRGSMPEIVQDGKTGFLVGDMAQACEAVERLRDIDPLACRKNAEENFSAAVMTDKYETIYYSLSGK